MLFNSPEFIFIFLPLACLLFFGFRRISKNSQLGSLALLSIVFYGYWHINNLPILLFTLTSNFSIAYILLKSTEKRIRTVAFFSGVALALLTLGYFKYYSFFIQLLSPLVDVAPPPAAQKIPVGISFYTFTAIAFLADIYSQRINNFTLLEYGTTITYFPHLVAGPILFHHSTIPQLRKQTGFCLTTSQLVLFIFFFSVGLCKKTVLADNIAQFADPIFNQLAQGLVPSIGEAWRASLCYTLQLYYDFSGYSDMAIGLACLVGIKIPLNFNSPYKSLNITEFWQRWHISLGYFFRNYLYIPLGGNRKGLVRTLTNIFIVMLLCGLWHGAGWTFIIWGCLHGMAMITQRLFSLKVQLPKSKLIQLTSILITFLFVNAAWVIFRADSITSALVLIKAMFGLGIGTMYNTPYKYSELWIMALLFIAWGMPNSYQIMENFQPAIALGRDNSSAWLSKKLSIKDWETKPWLSYSLGVLTAFFLISGTMYMFINGQMRYLYFDF